MGLAPVSCEGRPGNAALDGPAFVLVARLIERAVDHSNSPGSQRGAIAEGRRVLAASGEGHLENDSARIALEFEVLGPFGAGLEEELEDIALPERIVTLGAKGADLGVGHGSGVVNCLIVPDQERAGACSGSLASRRRQSGR